MPSCSSSCEVLELIATLCHDYPQVVLTAVANDEVRQATAWYAERSELAATRFVADYRDTRARAVEHPTQWPELEPGIRRVLFKHFPFAVIYLTDELRITSSQ